jgi:glutathione S-transferase
MPVRRQRSDRLLGRGDDGLGAVEAGRSARQTAEEMSGLSTLVLTYGSSARTLEEHYAFVLAYTHLVREEGWQHMRARFDSLPAVIRPLVGSLVRGRVKSMLWKQGILRHSHEDIVESALRDWFAVLAVMPDRPFFFGSEPTGIDAVVFGALATSVLTPIESPIRDFLRSQPRCVAFAERMQARLFPELAVAPSRRNPARTEETSHAVQIGA